MKMTSYTCLINLIVLGICAAVYAFTGFDLIKFITLGNDILYRSFLGICGVSALYMIYAIFIFKPFKGLK